MVRHSIRFRFRKDGAMRLVSHHDLMRCFERMLRRAALPYRSTQGFNPKPRLVFALSLALGIEGEEEIADLDLTEPMPADELRDRLEREAPAGLQILSAERIAPGTTAHVRRVTYRIALPAGREAGVPDRIAAALAAAHCWVERVRPQRRRVDLRPYLSEFRLLPGVLEMDLWVTPQGTARPDEVLGFLELGDLLDQGMVLKRVRLELQVEPSPVETIEGIS